MRGILPVLLIGMGVYLLRDFVFNSKKAKQKWGDYTTRTDVPTFATAPGGASFHADDFDTQNDFATETRVSTWKNK